MKSIDVYSKITSVIPLRKTRRCSALWGLLLILVSSFISVLPIAGQVQVPFALRHYSPVAKNGIYTIKGDFVEFANTNILGISPSESENIDFQFVDVDSVNTTFNSSVAELKLPSNIQPVPDCEGHDWSIVYAGLYWTGSGGLKVQANMTGSTRFDVFSVNLPTGSSYWYRTTAPLTSVPNYQYYRQYFKDQACTQSFGWVYLYVPNGNPYINTTSPNPGDAGLIVLPKQELGSNKGVTNNTLYYPSSAPVWDQIPGQYWSNDEIGSVLISKRKPNGSFTPYRTITAATTDRWIYNNKFVCFADITDYLNKELPTQGAGILGDYRIANIKTQEGASLTGTGNFGGWGIVVVYQSPDERMRNIAVFDGFADLQDNGTSGFAVGLDGIKAELTGPVNLKLGVMAGEGDRYIPNDWLAMLKSASLTPTTPLSHWLANPAENPSTTTRQWWYYFPDLEPGIMPSSTENYFASLIKTGTNTRLPNVVNNNGIDAHMYNLANTDKSLINNGQTQTAFSYRGSQDKLVLFMLALSVDAYSPEPIVYIHDVGLPSHTAAPGDTITYSADISNISLIEGVNNLKVTIPIPYNAEIVGNPTIVENNLPATACYNVVTAQYVNHTLNQIEINLSHLPGPNDLNTGACAITSWDPNQVWVKVGFQLKATDKCVYLDCDSLIQLLGNVSGIGSVTGTPFNVSTTKGWTADNVQTGCTRVPIYGAFVDTIRGQCVAGDSIVVDKCAGVGVIPFDVVVGQPNSLPNGSYKFYAADANWNKIEPMLTAGFPSEGRYLAYPVNNFTECNSFFKIHIYRPALGYRDRIYVIVGECSNGESWAKPMGDIQLAMKYARQEVWVAAGTYDSELTSDGYLNPGYVLKDSIKIYGGFRSNPTDAVDNTIYVRNPLDNPTILVQPDAATVPVVSSPATVNVGTVLNGFYIQNSEIGAASLKDKISLEYCVIRNNSTGINPTVKFNSGGRVVNSLITANTSTGGIMNFSGGGEMHFSTLASNNGEGITGAIKVSNSIVWGNSAQTYGAYNITYSGVENLNNNGVYGPTLGNNIALDPINTNTWGPNFGDAPGSSAGMLTGTYSNYWLNFFSRLKGVGDNAQVSTLSLTADLKLAHRIKGAKVDMGAFESRYLRTGAENPIWSGNTVNNMWPTDAQQGNPVASDFVSLDQATHVNMTNAVTLDGLIFCEGKDTLINPTSPSGNNRGIASLYTAANTLTVNDIYHERRFSPRKWHFLYIPFNVDVAGGVLDSTLTPMAFGTTFSVKYYDGINRSDYGSNAYATPGKNWTYINLGNTPNTTTIPKNRGHNFAVLEDRLVYFKANADAANKDFLGHANATLPMQFAPLGTHGAYDGDQGWNLFGVPYSSFFSMNTNVTFPQNWYEMRSKMFNVVFWNSDESGDKYIPVVTTLENKLFPPFSALFTEIMPDPQTSGTYNFTLNETGRVYQDRSYLYTPANIYHTRSATEEPVLLGLNIMKGNMSDRAVVVLSPDGLSVFEAGRDMAKFGNSNALVPQLSMVVDGKVLGINEIPPTGSSTQVPLRVYIGESGTYKINLESNPAIAANGYSAVLQDNALGVSRNITEGDYEFTSDAGTFDSRFVLNMLKVATSVETPTGDLVMYVNNKLLTVTGLNVGDRIEIFDITGQMNFTKVAQTDTETFRMRQKGVYLVKVYQATGTVSKKVIIE